MPSPSAPSGVGAVGIQCVQCHATLASSDALGAPHPLTQGPKGYPVGGRSIIRLEATAYCGCGYCCGWEYGAALGPLPLYAPLTWGRPRASGHRTLPILPKFRKKRAHHPIDRFRGLAVGAVVGAAVGTSLWVGKWGVKPLLTRGELGLRKALSQRHANSAAASALPQSQRLLTMALARNVEVGALTGAVLGASVMPVGRYWAETKLAGLPYEGTTASGTVPKRARPPLLSRECLFHHPLTIPSRLLTLQFRAKEGTIAADTSQYPLGTRMRVPGWGWGRVEDRGGAIQGAYRVDLYYDTHWEALRWGRRRIAATVHRK